MPPEILLSGQGDANSRVLRIGLRRVQHCWRLLPQRHWPRPFIACMCRMSHEGLAERLLSLKKNGLAMRMRMKFWLTFSALSALPVAWATAQTAAPVAANPQAGPPAAQVPAVKPPAAATQAPA